MSKNTQLGNLVNGIYVDSTGKVGVGTQSPSVALDVVGAGRFSGELTGTSAVFSSSVTATLQNSTNKEGFIVRATTTSAGGSQPAYTYYTAAGSKRWASFLNVGDDKYHISNASNTELFTITQAGNFGIGTTSPATILHINSPASTNATIYFGVNGTMNGYLGQAASAGSLSSGAAIGDVVLRSQTNLLFTSGGDTERMRITSAGNVGIGTTSPNKLLELAANSPVLRLTTTTQNTPSSIELGVLNGGNYGYAKIGVTNVQDYDTNLTFWTTPATSTTQVERMRITKDGNVGIGTNDPVSYSTRTLQIHNSVNNHAYIKLTNIDTGAALSDGFELASAGVNANIVLRESTGIITIRGLSGGVYLSNGSTSWAANSDERLKNINSNIENAVEKLSSLRAVNFSWKSDLSNREVLGLIAQDVEKAFPQIIDKNKIASDPSEENIDTTEYLGVRYVELIPVLVKAIQELKAEIDILKNK